LYFWKLDNFRGKTYTQQLRAKFRGSGDNSAGAENYGLQSSCAYRVRRSVSKNCKNNSA